jgi:hypothetical protein
VNCTEFQDYITAAVDRRLEESIMALFLEHTAHCSPCRRSYESERNVVALIRTRLHRVATPEGMAATILKRIALEDLRSTRARPPFLSRLLHAPLTKPAVVFALSFAAVVFLLSRSGSDLPPLPDPTGNDMISQSVTNYDAVLSGGIVPQVVSDVPDRVRAFFDGKTEFPVVVLVMRECTLVGGVLNDFHGAPLAHVMYRHGNQTIYVYQACRATVLKGEKLHLPAEALQAIERNGWFSGTTPHGDAIVVWAKGATLCAAVAPMKSEHLMAHLADAGEAGGW